MKQILLLVGLPLIGFCQPDVTLSYQFTTNTTSTSFDNRDRACYYWSLSYYTDGSPSAISIQLESAQNVTLAGVPQPGTFSAFGGTIVVGTNPLTSATSGLLQATGYYPWIRVNVSTFTGSGTLTAILQCSRSTGSRNNTITSNTLASTTTGIVRNSVTVAGPTTWTTLDAHVPWIGLELNANSFVKSTMANNGGAWPFATFASYLNLPSTAASVSNSPGYSTIQWGGITNTAFSIGASGAALGGERGELFCNVDNCGIFGITVQLVCGNTDPVNAGYTVHPCNRSQPLELDLVNDSASSATLYGMLIVGNSIATASTAYDAMRIQSLTGSLRSGTAVPFNNTLVSDIAAATHAVYARAVATGTSQNSQDIISEATFSNGAALQTSVFTSSVGTRTWNVPAGASYAWQVNGSIVSSMNSSGVQSGAGQVFSGTKFSTSGCSVSATTGGASGGKYTSGTAGTCTVVVTMGGSISAPNGWVCYANDQTTVADVQHQSASTTTTATITGTTASGDVISFGCQGY